MLVGIHLLVVSQQQELVLNLKEHRETLPWGPWGEVY